MFFNDLIFIITILLFSYFSNRFLLKIINKSKITILRDNDFTKPQAFHQNPTLRIGGITFFLSLNLVFAYLFFSKNIFYLEYLSFSTLFFTLGLIDDLKINLQPKFRLGLMIIFLIFLVIYNNFYITKVGLDFLNHLLEIDIFALFFVCLCFLFIINGSNLIDGFNGLLGLHALIIFLVLFFINLINENNDLAYLLIFISLPTLIFLKFNFPKAQIFFGDSGAYLVGSLIAISVIKTSILNPEISPFFFCILLFYLFFEVFFSFFRKLFVTRKSPLLPDRQHLHMLMYKFLLRKNKNKLEANYKVSLLLNSSYLLLLAPGVFLMEHVLFCRYYFLFLLIFYVYVYRKLNKKIEH